MFTHIIAPIVASALLCGFGRRLAGGAFQQWTGIDSGDLPVRLFFALTITAAAAAGGQHQMLPLLGAFALGFAGATLPMWGGLGFGLVANWKIALGLLAHGLLAALPLAVATAHSLRPPLWLPPTNAALPLLVGGVSVLPCYWAGWRLSGHGRADFPNGFRAGSEIGEFSWGACLGASVCISAMMGVG